LERVTRAQVAESHIRDTADGAAMLDKLLSNLDNNIASLPSIG
jgi:hypothetical protein